MPPEQLGWHIFASFLCDEGQRIYTTETKNALLAFPPTKLSWVFSATETSFKMIEMGCDSTMYKDVIDRMNDRFYNYSLRPDSMDAPNPKVIDESYSKIMNILSRLEIVKKFVNYNLIECVDIVDAFLSALSFQEFVENTQVTVFEKANCEVFIFLFIIIFLFISVVDSSRSMGFTSVYSLFHLVDVAGEKGWLNQQLAPWWLLWLHNIVWFPLAI